MVISDNTGKINELINKINSLPTEGSSGTGVDGKDGVSPTVAVEETDGGHNIVITDVNGTQSFFVPDGKDGDPGDDGVGVSSVRQTTTSTADGGTNVVTVTLSNGQTSTFNIKNGSKGSTGSAGSNATINGVNTLTITSGDGITTSQSGNTMTISANYEYGTEDLTAGTSSLATGKLYFVYE